MRARWHAGLGALALLAISLSATAQTGTIIIEKLTLPASPASFGFTENITPGTFSLSHGGTRQFSGVTPGAYTVTEDDPSSSGFTLAGIVCNNPTSFWDVDAREATIIVAANETVQCTFRNLETSATDSLFVFHLSGDQVVPPVATVERGGCMGRFNAAGSTLAIVCTHDVSLPAAMAIRRGAPGANGAVAFDLGNPASPVITAWSGMTPADVADLLAGNLHIDVGTAGRPAGAIRGQVLPRTVDTVAFTAGAGQVVPPDSGSATASCTADLGTDATALAINCTHDLASPNDAHVHQAPFGSNGPIVFTFPSPDSPLAANMPMTPRLVADFAATFLYLDIHTAAGRIRGQIGQPSFFADLAIEKTGPATIVAGNAIAYAITVTNNGPSAAQSVTLTDTLPAGTTFVSGTQTSGPAFTCTNPAAGAGGVVSCTIATLGPGELATFTLVFNVNASVAGGSTLTNTASVSSSTNEPAPADNSQSTSATVGAAPVTSFSGPSATGTGTITASFAGGGASCTYTVSRFIGPPPGAPPIPPTAPAPGLLFPHGLFDFTASACAAGSTLAFTITYPAALPPRTQYWKYGPTATDPTPHWYVLPATIAGNTVTFSITDGGLGDDDLAANGTIVDQGGPGVPPGPGEPRQVPTLSEWAMILMGLLLGTLGMNALRRR